MYCSQNRLKNVQIAYVLRTFWNIYNLICLSKKGFLKNKVITKVL